MSMTHDEMIAVIAAHKDGKTIQAKSQSQEWQDVKSQPLWNFQHNDYRIKPEPLVLWRLYRPNGAFYGTYLTLEEARQAKEFYDSMNMPSEHLTIKKFVEVTE